MTEFHFEPSGALALPTDAELAAADEDSAILGYSHGRAGDGRPYWAYIAIKPSLYREFRALSVEGKTSLMLSDYGEVIASDYESEPPEYVVSIMKETYGFDADLEEKMLAAEREAQAASLEKREEQRIMDIITMLKKQPD